jgi:hypothetical protein
MPTRFRQNLRRRNFEESGKRSVRLRDCSIRRRPPSGPDPLGWGAAQIPYLVVRSLTIQEADSAPRTLRPLVAVLVFAIVVLILIASRGYLDHLLVMVVAPSNRNNVTSGTNASA